MRTFPPVALDSSFMLLSPDGRNIKNDDPPWVTSGMTFVAPKSAVKSQQSITTISAEDASTPVYCTQTDLSTFVSFGLVNGPSNSITAACSGALPSLVYVQVCGLEETVYSSVSKLPSRRYGSASRKSTTMRAAVGPR